MRLKVASGAHGVDSHLIIIFSYVYFYVGKKPNASEAALRGSSQDVPGHAWRKHHHGADRDLIGVSHTGSVGPRHEDWRSGAKVSRDIGCTLAASGVDASTGEGIEAQGQDLIGRVALEEDHQVIKGRSIAWIGGVHGR